jgi:hypothetical protein
MNGKETLKQVPDEAKLAQERMGKAFEASKGKEKAPGYNEAVKRVDKARKKIEGLRAKLKKMEDPKDKDALVAKSIKLLKFAKSKGWQGEIKPMYQISAVASQVNEEMWRVELGVRDITDADQINDQLEKRFDDPATRLKVVKNFESYVKQLQSVV